MNKKLIVSGQSTLVQRRITFLSFELGSQRFAFGFFKHVARKVIGVGGGGGEKGFSHPARQKHFIPMENSQVKNVDETVLRDFW